jgi:hypothetical protein
MANRESVKKRCARGRRGGWDGGGPRAFVSGALMPAAVAAPSWAQGMHGVRREVRMKRFIWTVLATTVSTMGAAYALRLLDRVWRAATAEAPPDMPRWARLLVARPIKEQVKQRVRPDTP